MDEREREIVRRNHRLLVQNIILTDEFFDCLRNYHVLPETMIKDVKNESTRENRNSKLLELLVLRGCDSFRKLRHVLHLTGHCLLADHLYEEEADIKVLKPEDVFGKYPSMFNKVPDETKIKFIKTIESKVKEKSLLNTWVRNSEERTELLETRRASFETEKILRFKLENKRKQVRQIADEVKKLNEEMRRREIEIDMMNREEIQRKKAYKDELFVQAKFNAANSNSLIKLKDRFSNFNAKIRSINLMLKGFLGGCDNPSVEEVDNVKLTVLERNVKLVIEKARENKETVKEVDDERENILQLLKTTSKREEPLSSTIRRYLSKEDKDKAGLFKELERLRAVVRGSSKFQSSTTVTDLKLLRNMAATVRAEIEHLQKKLHWKDSQISELIDENTSLKQKSPSLSETPVLQTSSKSESSLSSPESTYEMDEAYENIDDYLPTNEREFSPHLAITTGRETNDGIAEDQQKTFDDGSDVRATDFSDDNTPKNYTSDIQTAGVSTPTTGSRHSKDACFEEHLTLQRTPQRVVRLDVEHDRNSTNSLILPDIMESDMKRHGLLRSSADLTKILENSNDNDELEKLTTLLANRTQFGKLPSIFQTVNYLPE